MSTNPLTRARQAIADIIADLDDFEIEATAFVPTGSNGYPLAFTEIVGTEFLNTRRGAQEVRLQVVVLVGADINEEAQEQLDALLAGASLSNALGADPQLRGTASDSVVTSTEPLNLVQLAGYSAWGHAWNISLTLGA